MTALCVTGMHRSGTSLVASLLTESGIRMHGGSSIGPDAGNELGHFEDWGFVRLCGDSIERQHPGSGGWRLLTPQDTYMSFSGRERLRARRLVIARYAGSRLWAWKDPRAVLFLPEWVRLAPSLRVLLLWRSASTTLDSLERRAAKASHRRFDISPEEAQATWMTHNQLALEALHRWPDRSVLVEIDALLAAGDHAVAALWSHLGLPPRTIAPISQRFASGMIAGRLPSSDDPAIDQLEARLRARSFDFGDITPI